MKLSIPKKFISLFERKFADNDSKNVENTIQKQLLYSENFNKITEIIISSDKSSAILEKTTEILGETLKADRALLYNVDFNKRKLIGLTEWLNSEGQEISSTIDTYDISVFKGGINLLWNSRCSMESHADDILPELQEDGSGELLHNLMQIKSGLWMPFNFREDGFYLLVFNQVSHRRVWHSSEKKFLDSITGQISIALQKIQFLDNLQQSKTTLQEREKCLLEAQKNAHVGNWKHDLISGEMLWSEESFRIVGLEPQKVTRDLFFQTVHPDDMIIIKRAVEESRRGKRENEQEFRIIRPNGQIRYINNRWVSFYDADGKEIKRVGTHQDITERKQVEIENAKLEEQLHRSQKLETLGTLTGGIAHDFNNILTPILGYSDMVMLKLSPSNPLLKDIEQIRKGAIRAKEMVEQILLFSKQVEKERKPLKLQLIVQEAMKLLRSSIPATIEIQYLIDASCDNIMADSTQIHQVIVNLCTNAWQAMEERGGLLSIDMKQVEIEPALVKMYPHLMESEYICLSISDTGIGMSQRTLDRIFEPFFTMKDVGKGTGMGLAVVHGIVRSHHGEVLVDSKLGEGSTFHMYLPAVKTEVIAGNTEISGMIGGKESILVVDDDRVITMMIKIMLEELGYLVDSYNSSSDALSAFRMQPGKYDLLISDLTMPKMTGIDLSEQIQRIQHGFPIIIITGYGNGKIEGNTMKQFGIRQIINKPLVMKELAAAVRSALKS